ncbi:MAG: DUF177 domain-containing protein [Anaerolineales bacterium]|nr:DUF177 domain-containing protein [Anaerolineales bacterium]
MTQWSRHPLRINVGFLLHEQAGYSRTFDFDHPAVQISEDLAISKLRGSLRFTRTAQGLYGDGQLEATTPMECVRCLSAFEQPLAIRIGDLFASPPGQATDPLLVVPETGVLDLSPLLREYLLLDVPLQPLCRSNCRGLCPECGNNLNESRCSHPKEPIDPRLAALQSLLDDSSGSGPA